MITRQEVFEGLYGAWRLLLTDRGAVALFDDSIAGFWKSFFAAFLVLPAYVLVVTFGPVSFESERNILAVLLIHAEFYIIGWILWPLIMGYATPVFDRGEKFALYVVAFNWSAAVRAGLLLAVFLISAILPLSPALAKLLDLLLLVVLLAYHMFVLRTTLDLPAGPAIGLTIFEFILSQVILGVQRGVLM
jgi:hypothetical protein